MDARFDSRHILEGQKLSESLLKRVRSEDPRTALIGLALTLSIASRECRLRKQHLFEMLTTLDNAMNNPTLNDAQEAASRLILPR